MIEKFARRRLSRNADPEPPGPMDEPTARALRAANRRFYDRHAAEFAATRERPWPGWDRLWPHLGRTPETTLDVGCGNGRFGAWLDENALADRYLGVDQNPALLARAEQRLRATELEIELVEADVLEPGWTRRLADRRFDLIAVFGLLHHVPGADARRELLRALAGRLAPGGTLALTAWNPSRERRLERKIVSWERFNRRRAARGAPPIDLARLEPGDYLLAWGGDDETPRYCHFAELDELGTWARLPGLEPRAFYFDDGPSCGDNQYLVLRRR